MKGITPVIAIILLLLMAVAAAGGFYFVYQNFASSGEESGSSQIDALGEQALSQITIESIAEGTVWVRNVGVSRIDTGKISVFVEGVPYSVEPSASAITENNRAGLSFVETPVCQKTSCQVKVSGLASASAYATQAQLTRSCGDGVCSENEKRTFDCYTDCGPSRGLIYMGGNTALDIYWNGSGWSWGESFTTGGGMDNRYAGVDAQGNMLQVFLSDEGGPNTNVGYSFFNGSDWSAFENLTDAIGDCTKLFVDMNQNGQALAIWAHYHSEWTPLYTPQYSVWDGSSWSAVQNVSQEHLEYAGIDYKNDGTATVSFRKNLGGAEYNWTVYEFDGDSWSESAIIPDSNYTYTPEGQNMLYTWVKELPDGTLMSFRTNWHGGDGMHQYSILGESGWSVPVNFTATDGLFLLPDSSEQGILALTLHAPYYFATRIVTTSGDTLVENYTMDGHALLGLAGPIESPNHYHTFPVISAPYEIFTYVATPEGLVLVEE